MNHRSHYQSAFFHVLSQASDVDLCVRYFENDPVERLEEGWQNSTPYQSYEKIADASLNPQKMLEDIDGYADRIHIVPRSFCPALVDYLCEKNYKWIHWSECYGINLARITGYTVWLFRLLLPVYLLLKRKEKWQLIHQAFGVFGQGFLARRGFLSLKVPEWKIADLYYSPNPLAEKQPDQDVIRFSQGRKIFLSVGAQCRRKGTDLLLKAFAGLADNDWCLVICGLDRADGKYQKMAKKLKIQDKVLFLGAYPVSEISSVYQASSVCILASRFDGWGVVLNEAASVGRALIGSDLCGASWHLIDEGNNGFMFQAGSEHDLRRCMMMYSSTPTLAARHGEYSKRMFFEKFTPECATQRCLQAINRWQSQ